MIHDLLNAIGSWLWPAALLAIFLALLGFCFIGARIESWHQRRRRLRLTNAWADSAHRIRFANQDFK